jgi:hypothetical protein
MVSLITNASREMQNKLLVEDDYNVDYSEETIT